MNLVKNALKFTKSGAEIAVNLNYEATASIVVTVTDTGIGFEPEEAPKLFTRFGKLQRTAKLNSEGIGLGLTIVKSIIEKAEGSVHAFSEGVGKGSVFSFAIPMPCCDDRLDQENSIEEESNEFFENELIVFDEHPDYQQASKE